MKSQTFHPYCDVSVLTGSSGSGKSTAAKILAELGALIVSADEIARQVVTKGSPGLAELVHHLGPEILDKDGCLDRKKLHKIIINNDILKVKVESILHPIIKKESKIQFIQKINSNSGPVIYDCPLYFEKKLTCLGFKRSILITATTDKLLSRIMERDQISEEEAQARLSLQMDQAEKIKLSDITIENNGTIAELKEQLKTLYSTL